MTLPGLVRGAGRLRPDRLVICDSGNAATLLGRPARTLTAAAFEQEILDLARKLAALGLAQGERVLVQLPNTVEAAIGILGVMSAGGVPAVTPVFSDEQDLLAQANEINAVGILTVARFAGTALAERARGVTARCDTIRFVAAFGERAPSGVAALDAWSLADVDQRLPAQEATGDAPALITFDRIDGLRAFVRSHEQIIAEAAAAAAVAQIGPDSRLMVTLPPASLAGVVFGLAAPLLTGATANLVALFDGCLFARSLGDGRHLAVVLPAAAEEAFHHHCSGRRLRAETLVFVHRPAPAEADPPALPPGKADRTLDATALGETCLMLARRGRPAAKTASRRAGGDAKTEDQPQLTLASADGKLRASGFLAPRRIGSSDSVVDTGFPDTALPVHGAMTDSEVVQDTSAA
jgi:acyl-CoA synthetase (AMP-forming)/AMP-acid ligase II